MKYETALLFVVVMITVLSVFTASDQTFAQINPCPSGEYPALDVNGDFIIDNVTQEPVCVPTPQP